MSTEIQVWQVSDGRLRPLEGGLAEAGRREYEDLEAWIASNPAIIGRDITIIGRQVPMSLAKNDFLRQVIGYENHPQYPWLKGVYFVRDEYRDLLSEVLREVEGSEQAGPGEG